MVRGTRKVAIDQRRRFGRHGQSRRLLAADGARSATARGTWQDLVGALQRQAVHSALAQLRKTDRQILTLAYLQGHTNREIAAMLGVSISTVSRRISTALSRLDEYVRQARIWAVTFALLGLAHLRSLRWPAAMPTAAAATAAVVTMGLVAVGPVSRESGQSAPPPAARAIGFAPVAPLVVLPLRVHEAAAPTTSSPKAALDTDKSCHGNRLRPRGHHPSETAVSRTAAAGCQTAS